MLAHAVHRPGTAAHPASAPPVEFRYLLKPVNRARLAKTIERVRRGGSAEEPLDRAIRTAAAPVRFLARKGAGYRVVNSREVLCFVSEEGMTRLRATADQQYWMPPTLNELEQRLDPRHFFRISRAAIVHLDAVREIAPTAGGHGEVTLRDGTRLEVSRRRFRELTERLGHS
jgi:two-component system LytT family response regulator